MLSVCILERPGEGFAAQVAAALPDVAVTNGGAGDVVIVSPSYGGAVLPQRGTLLVPTGGTTRLSGAASASNAVTYGMSPNATLTLSAIGERTAMLAVQQELRNALGEPIEQQELRVASCGSAEATIAAAGASIMLGLKPSDGT